MFYAAEARNQTKKFQQLFEQSSPLFTVVTNHLGATELEKCGNVMYLY